MNNDESLTPPDPLLEALATRVRVLRREQGLTQEQLADRAGLNPRHVQKVEAGELNVTISTLSALALALGVTITDLIEPHLVSESRPQTTSLSRLSPNEMLPCCRNTDALNSIGLTPEMLCHAIFHAYTVIDSIDSRLLEGGLERLGGGTVELANLSSIIGNLLGAGVALHSGGQFVRNGSHKFPDLVSVNSNFESGIEIKVALETNIPKGHLAKSGIYFTFRYVLVTVSGFDRSHRGDIVSIWEVRCGRLSDSDFSLSNTAGDSGKTAVIKTEALRQMSLVYFDQALCPYKRYVYFN